MATLEWSFHMKACGERDAVIARPSKRTLREHGCSLFGSSPGVAHLGLLAGTMAASSGDDIPTQLAALLGYTIKRIRITDEVPPRISVIDLAAAITMKDANQAAEQVAYVKN